MPYRLDVLLRTLCLAGVAFAPLASMAQTTDVSLRPSVAPEAPAQSAASPESVPATAAAAPVAAAAASAEPAAAPAAPASTPPIAPPEQVNITASQNSTGVASIVNDYVISNYDLDQRTALFVTTSGVRPTKETLAQIRAQVLRSLQDEVLELQEAGKRKITVTKVEVDRALQNIAEDNKLTASQILATIGQAGVTPETFRQQLGAQLVWQKLVTARYGTDILINDQQVDEAMERLKLGADKPQFLVSEIFVAVDRPEDETTIRSSAEQIAQQLKDGAPFNTVAGQFSQSPSAADGGDIGWVVQGQLAEDLDQALAKLRPGDTAGPIRAEGGYYVVQLRDRREPFGTVVADAPPVATDPAAPLPLDRLLIPLPPNVDAMVKERAMTLANNVKAQVRSCTDLPIIAKQLQGSVYTRLGQMNPKDLNPELRDALIKTGPGEMVAPFFSPAGLEVIMRCDPAPPKLVAFQLPTRAQLEQQLFLRQMSVFAKSYLRDLRRDAVVETR